MATFEIWEEGSETAFTEVEAESAEEALEIAEEECSREAKRYGGYTGPVTWRACRPGERFAASREVQVS